MWTKIKGKNCIKESIVVKDCTKNKSIVNANRCSAQKGLGEGNIEEERSDRNELNSVAVVQNTKENRNTSACYIDSVTKSTMKEVTKDCV